MRSRRCWRSPILSARCSFATAPAMRSNSCSRSSLRQVLSRAWKFPTTPRSRRRSTRRRSCTDCWHGTARPAMRDRSARRGADWLVSVQEPDGSWARYFYNNVATDYAAHLSCWIAELGADTGEDRYLNAASRHLDWVLGDYYPETGWFQRAGFTAADHASGIAATHTIAYTI